MIESINIDVTSIKIVKSELAASIEQSSRHFEAFIADRSAADQLAESLKVLSDVHGVLKLLSTPGAIQLVGEMSGLLATVIETADKTSDFVLSALSHAFVGLPCYIEYIIDKEKAMPFLLLPFINEVRAASRQAIILESDFAAFTANEVSTLNIESDSGDDAAELTKRMRQMFQVGLIGLIREENLEFKVRLMHRATSRLAKGLDNAEAKKLMFLSQSVFEAILGNALNVNFTRKRVLSLIDQAIKSSVDNSFSADTSLVNELVYYNAVSDLSTPALDAVKTAYGLERPVISDAQLQAEKELMQGPNAETIMTMVKALREELAQTKEVLEIAAQGVSQASDFTTVVSLFQRSADILSVVGLTTAGQILSDLKVRVSKWAEGAEYQKEELLEVADGLIYVESVLNKLNRMDLNFDHSEHDEEAKRQLMASSQVDEAELLVLQESQSSIAIAKNDITSYIESDFDVEHIQHIGESLTSVNGGLAMLGLGEAKAVVDSCSRFVAYIVENGIDRDQAENVLETLADALIALEYYLSEIELHQVAPPNVLNVAEQSLEALGFPVEK